MSADEIVDSDDSELTRLCECCERYLPKECFCGYCGLCSDCCTAHEPGGEPVPEEYDEDSP